MTIVRPEYEDTARRVSILERRLAIIERVAKVELDLLRHDTLANIRADDHHMQIHDMSGFTHVGALNETLHGSGYVGGHSDILTHSVTGSAHSGTLNAATHGSGYAGGHTDAVTAHGDDKHTNAERTVYYPARAWSLVDATSTFSITGTTFGRFESVVFPFGTTTQYVGLWVTWPSDRVSATSFYGDFYWAPLNSTPVVTTYVRFVARRLTYSIDTLMSSAPTSFDLTGSVAPITSETELRKVTVDFGAPGTTEGVKFVFGRAAGHADDTFSGNVGFIGMNLRYTAVQ